MTASLCSASIDSVFLEFMCYMVEIRGMSWQEMTKIAIERHVYKTVVRACKTICATREGRKVGSTWWYVITTFR